MRADGRRRLGWFAGAVALVVALEAVAAPAPHQLQPVRAKGETRIVARLNGSPVVATFVVHQVAIGSGQDAPPKRRLSSCTYSRIPCSVVDAIELSVNGADVLVPRSVVADLSDVNRAWLQTLPRRRFELVLDGGDASEGYEAHIVFDRQRVLERTIIPGEAGGPSEHTTYFDVSKAFDQAR